jgi:transposase
MNMQSLFDFPQDFEVINCEGAQQVITLTVVSTQTAPCCPLCGTRASRLHSQYHRQLSDLPCAGQRVRLIRQVRKFFCDESTCQRKIFAERLAPFIQPWARVTTRLCEAAQHIGLATSGKLGARLSQRLGMATSWMTVIRRMMALATPPVEQVVQLGIDDFSWRRGRTFGTILVDLQSHTVIDLLPDRQAESAAVWMATHPELELVSRDRGGDYAAAAATGAPQARQCADRFHLLKNVGEAVQGVLSRHLAVQRHHAAQPKGSCPLSAEYAMHPPRRKPAQAAIQQAKRAERLARYQQVVRLRQEGLSQTAIAERVGVAHGTVSRWLAAGPFPEQRPRPRQIALQAHLAYLCERWEAGCHNMSQLYRELVARGYTHSYWSVYEQLIRLLPAGRKTPETSQQLACPPVSARQAMFLLLGRSEDLKADDQAKLALLRSLPPEVEQTYELVQQFREMLRTRTGEQLDDWLQRVRASRIRELQGVVRGMERDKAAVVAGLTLPQNNGVVEGHVNKLKLLKRMMYGRAKFPLLRQRVLHAL